MKQIRKTFNTVFTKGGGEDLEGIALGIAEDTAPNFLWQLLNGEMPEGLNPKVWRISIGILI